MGNTEIKSIRYYYQYFKGIYDISTFKELQKEIPSIKRWSIYYLALSIALSIDFMFPIVNESILVIFIRTFLGIVGLGGMIWIIKKAIIDCIQQAFPMSKRVREYNKYWLGARYEIFKKNLHKNIVIDFDKIHELLQGEIKEARTTIWDHKLFATGVSFLLIGWTAIAKMLADGNSIQHIILLSIEAFVIFLFLVVPIFWGSTKTEEKKLKEMKQFLYWFEYDLVDEEKGIQLFQKG